MLLIQGARATHPRRIAPRRSSKFLTKLRQLVHREFDIIHSNSSSRRSSFAPPPFLHSTFGAGFLNKFEASVTSSPLLESVTLIDSPGVLSGEKQRVNRSYDFSTVVKWFAERSDLILLLFDAHKLDVSDEFRDVIEKLKPHDDKVRCVLNKADQINKSQFVRVYGSLLWR